MKALLTIATLAFAALAPAPAGAAEAAQIALLGDSTVITSYLPAGERHHEVLEVALKKALPGRSVAVVNWADNGESIARYLINGRYDRQRRSQKKLDVAVIRFGINDQKHSTVDRFRSHLETLIDLLETDFPGVTVLLETGPFVEYPAYYEYDREAVLAPYWDATRQVAKERNLRLIDFHAASQQETRAGNWDQRIRLTERPGEPRVFDDRYDQERGNPRWFSDIHPNPNGVAIAVKAETPLLVEVLKNPKQSRSLQLPARTESNRFPEPRDYSSLLDFSPERLKKPSTPPNRQDRFQNPTAP